jgi:hypothetical protein
LHFQRQIEISFDKNVINLKAEKSVVCNAKIIEIKILTDEGK